MSCHCDIQTLQRQGCACGGFTKEQKAKEEVKSNTRNLRLKLCSCTSCKNIYKHEAGDVSVVTWDCAGNRIERATGTISITIPGFGSIQLDYQDFGRYNRDMSDIMYINNQGYASYRPRMKQDIDEDDDLVHIDLDDGA